MRIALLLDFIYPDSHGGLEIFVYRLGRALRDRGHEVIFACPTADAAPPARTVDGMAVHHYPVPADLTPAEFRFRVPPRLFDHYERWLDAVGPDVVHAHCLSHGGSVFHLEAARRRGARAFQSLHIATATCLREDTPMLRWGRVQCDGALLPLRCSTCYLHERGVPRPLGAAVAGVEALAERLVADPELTFGSRGALPQVVSRQRRWLERLADAVDRMIVVAEWQRSALIANGISASRIARIPHGAAASGRRDASAGPIVLGWAGRAIPEKGLGDLLEAMARAPELSLEVHVACFASSERQRRYRDLWMERTRRDPRVVWRDPFPADEVSDFYTSIDALVAPYSLVEVGPMTVVEALAHGVPAIAYDVGGASELVRDDVTGRLVPRGDIGALTRALRDAADRDRLERWAAAARWDRTYHDVASDHLALYDPGATSVPSREPRPGTIRP